MGIPALIGGTGFAVDTAQWYMWKREMQYAVDQAAIAGAWARASEETEDTYTTRAEQEFGANIDKTDTFVSDPDISLADYAGGDDNSVAVSATATRTLPFSSFLTGEGVTIRAYAQASFEDGATYTSCLVAVDEDDKGAINIGGNAVLTAQCGLAALSTNEQAITVDGTPTIDAGWVLAAGGIDDWFNENTDDTILEYVDGLRDPFEGVEPPNPAESQTARTYSCAKKSKDTTTADITTTLIYSYNYYKGNQNSTEPTGWVNPKVGYTDGPNTQNDILVPNGTVAGTTTTTTSTRTLLAGTGNNRIWEVETKQTSITYSDVKLQTGTAGAALVPGTYTDLKISCDTTFATGVYILDGGSLDISGQYEVTGSNIMIVLKNGAGFKINGGANINLTAIQAADLIARGVPADQANELAGMLIFEDRASKGNGENMINGNASTVLNGAIYTSVSGVSMAGTASVTSQCLMIAARTIDLTGTLDMSTFCPPEENLDDVVAVTSPRVRLVA